MESWGMPAYTFFIKLKLSFSCTDYLQFFKELHIISNALIENPYAFNCASTVTNRDLLCQRPLRDP